MLLSIVVPVYNTELYLRKCIDSIICQTYSNWELILVNDGSTDNSGKICDEYKSKDSRIKVYHKLNGGVSSARNLGIEKSIGDWIIFIDSDDYVEKTYIQDFFQSSSMLNSNCLIIQGLIFDFTKYCTFRKFPDQKYNFRELPQCIIANDLFTYGGPICKLYNRSIIKSAGLCFPEAYSYGEDTIFFLKYINLIEEIILIPSCKYHYIQNDKETLSRKAHNFNMLKLYVIDNLTAIKQLDDKFMINRSLMRCHKKSINGLFKKMVIDLYKLGSTYHDRLEAFKELKQIICRFSCHKYSLFAVLVLITPIFMLDLVFKGILSK